MSEALQDLLVAAGVAVFARSDDGAFTALAPVPPWFERLLADRTFPFLGHVLEEANAFWAGGEHGSREYGPSVGVNPDGREFHYVVAAVTGPKGQYLVFRQDAASERMREVLQAAREEALRRREGVRADELLLAVQAEVRRSADRLGEVTRRFLSTRPTPEQVELLQEASRDSRRLIEYVDRLVFSRQDAATTDKP